MYDIAIIGAGPTGASAALMAGKAGKKVILFDNGKSMTKRAWVENHYGIMEISGPDLVHIGKKQAEKFGAEIIEETVIDVKGNGDGFEVQTETNSYETKTIIFATGVLTDLAEKIGLELVEGTEPRIKRIIKIDQNGETNQKGIYATGTVAGTSVHTIVTAGHGASVAINIISDLNGTRYVDHDVLKES